LANSLPESDDFNAFENRSLVKEVRFSFDEMRTLFAGVAALEYRDLTEDDRKTVLQGVLEEMKLAHEGISLRMLIKAFEFYRWDKTQWLDAFRSILSINEQRKIFYDAEEKFPSVEERISYWQGNLGLGRRSYFRLKSKLKAM
jgi:hypothetical protein